MQLLVDFLVVVTPAVVDLLVADIQVEDLPEAAVSQSAADFKVEVTLAVVTPAVEDLLAAVMPAEDTQVEDLPEVAVSSSGWISFSTVSIRSSVLATNRSSLWSVRE